MPDSRSVVAIARTHVKVVGLTGSCKGIHPIHLVNSLPPLCLNTVGPSLPSEREGKSIPAVAKAYIQSILSIVYHRCVSTQWARRSRVRERGSQFARRSRVRERGSQFQSVTKKTITKNQFVVGQTRLTDAPSSLGACTGRRHATETQPRASTFSAGALPFSFTVAATLRRYDYTAWTVGCHLCDHRVLILPSALLPTQRCRVPWTRVMHMQYAETCTAPCGAQPLQARALLWHGYCRTRSTCRLNT